MPYRGARESDPDNRYQREADEEIAKNPPNIVWEPTGRGGIWVARLVSDRHVKPGRRRKSRPPCDCNLYGSPRRRPGGHHDENCARREPW